MTSTRIVAVGVPADSVRLLISAGLAPNHCSGPVITRCGLEDPRDVRAVAAAYESVQNAVALGQLELSDRAAVTEFLKGAVGAQLAHQIADPIIKAARGIEADAAGTADEAVAAYTDAVKISELLHDSLPKEPVDDPRGLYAGYNRAQIRDLVVQHLLAIQWFLSIGRRDVVRDPVSPSILVAVAVVISSLESWLITSRLVDFSIYDVTSWIMLAAFGAALFTVTHYYSQYAGQAIRAYRDSFEAMRDITRVGLGHLEPEPLVEGRAEPSPTGTELAARANTTDPSAARRQLQMWLSAGVPLAAVYASITYMRVYEMASRLPGYPTGFPELVAVLFAGVAIALLRLVVHWESSRSSLREDAKHILALDRATIEREQEVRGRLAGRLHDKAQKESESLALLSAADNLRSHASETVARALQGLSAMCSLTEVVQPHATNLFRYDAPDAERARSVLSLLAESTEAADKALLAPVDYTPDVRKVCHWYLRTMEGDGGAYPAYIDPARRGTTPDRAN